MTNPIDFFLNKIGPPVAKEPLPPEAATREGFEAAIEEMIRAFNIIGKYDSHAMARAWNENVQNGKWDYSPSEEITHPEVVISAQRVKMWLAAHDLLLRLGTDLRTIGIDHTAESRPKGLQ